MHNHLVQILTITTLLAHPAWSAISLSGSSMTDWISLGDNYDFLADQQTGQADSDIVGNAANPGLFAAFDGLGTSSLTDGLIAFRIRFDEPGKQGNQIAFSTNAWIGIDGDLNGSVDAFLGINTQANPDLLEIRDAGTGLDVSPSTTSLSNTPYYSTLLTASNSNYRAVDTNLDGGTTADLTPGGTDTDYYLSFQIDFSQLVAFFGTQGISVDENTPFRYVVATSTQTNSFNQDIGGVDGNDPLYDPATSWEENGGFSSVFRASGQAVPEPTVALMLACSGLLVMRRQRR